MKKGLKVSNCILIGYRNEKMLKKKDVVMIRERKGKNDRVVVKLVYNEKNEIVKVKLIV